MPTVYVVASVAAFIALCSVSALIADMFKGVQF